MKWYIGQPIVAIENHPDGKFKKGDEFIIKGLRGKDCGCKCYLIDVGHKAGYVGKVICSYCRKIAESGTDINWYNDKRFAPLDVDISELTEILETTEPFTI